MATASLYTKIPKNSFAYSPNQQVEPYKIENKVWGAVLEFFGAALKVEPAAGKTEYIRISELKEKLVIKNIKFSSEEDVERARKDVIIHDLFLSTINPFKKSVVALETLNHLNQKLTQPSLDYSSSNPQKLYHSLREIRAALYTQKGMTKDQNEFISNIQVGDIVFHRTEDTVHSDIVQLQQIANTLGLGPKHRDAIHHNHVYLCAKIDEKGKRWFAEAAWPSGKFDEIRLISEDDPRCFIKQDHGAISELIRCTDPTWAKKAAEEALKITTQLEPLEDDSDEKQLTALSYSIQGGAFALLLSNEFGHFAKMRLIQQVRSTNDGSLPSEFSKNKAFFCSSLVGYCYQVGEAREMVTKMLEEDSGGSPLRNRIHSNLLAIRHRGKMNQELQFKIDPKRSTPGDLYSYLIANKTLFTSIQSYQQPTEI